MKLGFAMFSFGKLAFRLVLTNLISGEFGPSFALAKLTAANFSVGFVGLCLTNWGVGFTLPSLPRRLLCGRYAFATALNQDDLMFADGFLTTAFP